MLDAVS